MSDLRFALVEPLLQEARLRSCDRKAFKALTLLTSVWFTLLLSLASIRRSQDGHLMAVQGPANTIGAILVPRDATARACSRLFWKAKSVLAVTCPGQSFQLPFLAGFGTYSASAEARAAHARSRVAPDGAQSDEVGASINLATNQPNVPAAKVNIATATPSEKRFLEPNAGFGYDFGNFSWTQKLREVTVVVPVPPGTKGKDLDVDIKRNVVSVGLKGSSPLVAGNLFHEIELDECDWEIRDGDSSGRLVEVNLRKKHMQHWWDRVFEKDQAIDLFKVISANSAPEVRDQLETKMKDFAEKANKNGNLPENGN